MRSRTSHTSFVWCSSLIHSRRCRRDRECVCVAVCTTKSKRLSHVLTSHTGLLPRCWFSSSASASFFFFFKSFLKLFFSVAHLSCEFHFFCRRARAHVDVVAVRKIAVSNFNFEMCSLHIHTDRQQTATKKKNAAYKRREKNSDV